jgi:hypothetical protein
LSLTTSFYQQFELSLPQILRQNNNGLAFNFALNLFIIIGHQFYAFYTPTFNFLKSKPPAPTFPHPDENYWVADEWFVFKEGKFVGCCL